MTGRDPLGNAGRAISDQLRDAPLRSVLHRSLEELRGRSGRPVPLCRESRFFPLGSDPELSDNPDRNEVAPMGRTQSVPLWWKRPLEALPDGLPG